MNVWDGLLKALNAVTGHARTDVRRRRVVLVGKIQKHSPGMTSRFDSSSGTFMVKILVEPGMDAVKPGMGCETRFLPCEQA